MICVVLREFSRAPALGPRLKATRDPSPFKLRPLSCCLNRAASIVLPQS
jgi:hypothetical protein